MVDDYTRGLWTILLPTKKHVNKSIKDFFAYVHTQFGVIIKCFQIDNGREFLRNVLFNFLLSQGTVHHTTCQYTP